MSLNTQLLEKLEKSLGNVLVAADCLKGNKKPWKARIIGAVRKLRIMRELNQRYYIAITGTQGAGKTRLIRALYDLDTTWLEDNSGRGEKIPVFIIEKDDIEAPQGAVLRLVKSTGELEEDKVESGEFRKIVASWGDGDDGGNLFPLLYVPCKHFGGNSVGFVLLPGFERESTRNSAWQVFMKYVLAYASGSIIVTDSTRLAGGSQDQVRDATTSDQVPGSKPIVAISKTELIDEPAREDLRERAAKRFAIDAAEKDRIVCTGVGSIDFEQAWTSELMQAMEKYVMLGMDVKTSRWEALDEVVDGEVGAIFEDVEAALIEGGLASTLGEDSRNRILDLFRKARADYRIRYEKSLGRHTRVYARMAKAVARQRYEKEEEGFNNSVRSVGRWFSTTSGAREDIHVKRIQDCWVNPSPAGSKPNGIGLLESDWRALSDQSARYLNLSFKEDMAEKTDDVEKLLGYDKLDVAKMADPAVVAELRKLLSSNAKQSVEPLENKHLGDVLKLVPALTMEYLRINQCMLLTHQDRLPEQPTARSLGEFMAELAGDLPAVSDTARTLLRTMGAILAVDVAIDGTVDTIPGLIHAIFGGATVSSAGAAATGATATAAGSATAGTAAAGGTVTAATLGATLSIVAAGLIIVGVVSYKITQHAQQLDAAHRGYINAVIDQYAEAHILAMLDAYDDAMDLIEERIHDNLGRAYGIDQVTSTTDNLLRALAGLDRARLSVLGGLRAKQLLA